MTPDLFVDFCKPGPPRMLRVVDHGLPADAAYVRHGVDVNGDLQLIIWSASFADVPLGSIVPQLPPVRFEVVDG